MQALAELAKPIYPEEMLSADWKFIKEKLGVTDEDLERWMHMAPVAHKFYGSDQWIYTVLEKPYVTVRHWVGNRLRAVKRWFKEPNEISESWT